MRLARLGFWDDALTCRGARTAQRRGYKLGKASARWGARVAHVVLDPEACWCHPEIIPLSDGAQIIVHEKGADA